MGRVAFPLNEEAVLGSVIQTLVLSTSLANKLCYNMMATAMLMIVIIAAEASPIMGASRKRKFCDSNDNENDAFVTTWR